MLTTTIGGSSDTEAKAVAVVPMSSRPSRTVTSTTPVAKPESASVNSAGGITATRPCRGSVDLPGAGQRQGARGGRPEPGGQPGQRSPRVEPDARGGAVLAGVRRAQPVQRRG